MTSAAIAPYSELALDGGRGSDLGDTLSGFSDLTNKQITMDMLGVTKRFGRCR